MSLGSLPAAAQAAEGTAHAGPLPEAPGTATIAGTVLDTNDDVIEGAHVVLLNPEGKQETAETGSDGRFEFPGLVSGDFHLTVTGPDMGTYASPAITLKDGEFRIVSGVVLPVVANTAVTVSGDQEEIAEQEVQIESQQRVLGVLPNFYSSYDWKAVPLGTKQKFELAFHAVRDPVAFAGAGFIAGVQQANDTYPEWGQGWEGYATRFGAAYGNDFLGRMLASAALPSLFHQDPRYFYKGTGSVRSRVMYALERTVVCRGDNGRDEPNFSHVLGSFAAGAISNTYYPKSNQGVSLVITNGLIETAGQAANNLMREFLFKRITTRGHAEGQ